MSIKLIDNWRQWPKMYSTWAFGSIAIIQSTTAFLSESIMTSRVLFMADTTWAGLISSITAALAISGAVGRLIAQNNVSEPAEEKPDGN